jgi:hypothetical protein
MKENRKGSHTPSRLTALETRNAFIEKTTIQLMRKQSIVTTKSGRFQMSRIFTNL